MSSTDKPSAVAAVVFAGMIKRSYGGHEIVKKGDCMQVRKVRRDDIDHLDKLFRVCISDLLIRENKELRLAEEEVDRLNRIVMENLADYDIAFYVAELNGRVVGTIALTRPNPIISQNIRTESNVYEISCVYVHPSYQRQGIGKLLFQHIKKELIRRGNVKYYLDAGFSSSQQYWQKLLGKPSFILKDYWGEGQHHFIWHNSFHDNQG